MPTTSLPAVRFIIDLVSAAVCFVLARAGYKFLAYEIEEGTKLFKDVPAWIFQIIIPAGFALIGFRFILMALRQVLEKPTAET